MRARPLELLPGISGHLVSGHYTNRYLATEFAGSLGEDTRADARKHLVWRSAKLDRTLGPASSVSTLVTRGARPVLEALGYSSAWTSDARGAGYAAGVATAGHHRVPTLVCAWGDNMDRLWTPAARAASREGSEWALCFNGRALRLCDARQAWSRSYLEFELAAVAAASRSFSLYWALLRPPALEVSTRLIVEASARLGVGVCASLRDGVREALVLLARALAEAAGRRRSREPDAAFTEDVFDQALTIIYRLLFLLFAESRALVPVWHPLYRTSYTVESLRHQAEHASTHRGIWQGVQALSRLAHAGCRAGSLTVTPFNGRLFSPQRAPLAEHLRLDDDLVAQAVAALTTLPGQCGREPISFRDLGVEQLGAVYESVLDYEPRIRTAGAAASAARGPRQSLRPRVIVELRSGGGLRKSSGTFYTPQSMTDEVVRHALTPLVTGRSPAQILELRVLDPAMGSGAFLVSACRFLASAYEDAVVACDGRMAGDITDGERAEFRRMVARRCLYGVDANPMAVQVARLSLWLATLAADRPLTFLDHHLAVGDSLLGTSPDDMARQAPGRSRTCNTPSTLPLFDLESMDRALERVLPLRRSMEAAADNTADTVHAKERLAGQLHSQDGPLAAIRRCADLWCATWFWEDGAAPDAREFSDLAAAASGGRSTLPARFVQARLAEAARVAARKRFFHWPLEFPEVFYDENGNPRASGGFDAILGNPPWEMLRGDSGPADQRESRRRHASRATRFVRESGIYPSCSRGHVNQYQLFIERSLDLARPGGRVGLIVPWGLLSDHGCAGLRDRLLNRCTTDRLVGFENSGGIFPIHRGVRFVLLSTTRGGSSRRIRCRFGLTDPTSRSEGNRSLVLSRDDLARLSGPSLTVPHVTSRTDLNIVTRLVGRFPALGDPAGWGAVFGRELNATDDADLITGTRGPIPVVEGKHLEPFRVRVELAERWVKDADGAPKSAALRHVSSSRLAYRDVAASTNRVTLIAAIVPAGVAAVHTLFCLKTPMPLRRQRVLSALLNSLPANYLARLRVTTHLGTGIVARLPVPRPDDRSEAFGRLAALAARLEHAPDDAGADAIELQARAMRLYELSEVEVDRILETFPLLAQDFRANVRRAWKETEFS